MSALAALVAEGLLRAEVSLAPLTTYKFGGPARYYLEASSEADLGRLADARTRDAAMGPSPQILVVGRGSNLVVSDSGFDGIVVHLGPEFVSVRVDDDGLVVAGGATPLPSLARRAADAGRGGLEFYVGIPGAVGGAVAMNAGCFGTETSDVMARARVIDMDSDTATWETPISLCHSYRHSRLGPADVVVGAEFATEAIDAGEGRRRMREVTQWRRRTQPGGTFNAGSVFKNPPGDAAGRIIDALGLKGFSIGGAAVSERHANFFVAEPDAMAQDVFDLVAAVRAKVAAETGVELQPEIRFAGDFSGSAR